METRKITRHCWKYISRGSLAKKPLQIIPPIWARRKIPETLYKYYKLNDKSVEAIEEGYVYASHPYQLNDLFDCSEAIIKYDDKETVKKILRGSIPDIEIDEGFKNNDKLFFHKLRFNLNVFIYSSIGIVSLTEDYLSVPMWSYYTNNAGFVVEFDHSKFDFLFHGPFQVNYKKKFRPVSIKKGWDIGFLFQSNIKKQIWSHEKEWRILPDKEGYMEVKGFPVPDNIKFEDRKFNYGRIAIKRIILANKFFDRPDEELIDNKDGTFRIELKTKKDFKGRLIKQIIDKNIPTYIIGKDYPNFKLIEVPVKLSDDGTLSLKYVEPIKL